MNHQLSSAFTAKPIDATKSGVRVSCSPRSSPLAANTTSIAGMPRHETVR